MTTKEDIDKDFKLIFQELGNISQRTKGAEFLNKLRETCILGNQHIDNLDIAYRTVLSHAALDLILLDRSREHATLLSNFLKEDNQVLYFDATDNKVSIHTSLRQGRIGIEVNVKEKKGVDYFDNRVISKLFPGDCVFMCMSKDESDGIRAFSTYGRAQDYVKSYDATLFNLILEE